MKAAIPSLICLAVLQFSILGSRGADKEVVQLPRGKAAWSLKRLDADPIKLIKTTYYPDRSLELRPANLPPLERHSVVFLVEFTRDLKPADNLVWDQSRVVPPYSIRLLDEDGVVLRTVRLRYDSEPVFGKGRRMRLVLDLPEALDFDKSLLRLFEKTKQFVIE